MADPTQTLQTEFLDHTDTFADLAAAQAALTGWIDAYNQQRPHQSLDMATPASRFHTAESGAAPPPPAAARTSAGHAGARRPTANDTASARLPTRSSTRSSISSPDTSWSAVEVHLAVPASGCLSLAGHQEVWVGRAFAGQTVLLWADQRSIHLAHAGAHLKPCHRGYPPMT